MNSVIKFQPKCECWIMKLVSRYVSFKAYWKTISYDNYYFE